MTLRATTLLAENTTALLGELCREIAHAGLDIEFDDGLDFGERRDLVEGGMVDVVWACGLLTAELVDSGLGLEVVAAPVFEGEAEPVYRSVIVTRAGRGVSMIEALDGRLAVNEYGSWSGWHAYVQHLRSKDLAVDRHPTQVVTGSHRNSLLAVLEGVADVASVDSSVWLHLVGELPELAGLETLEETVDWPAPPLSIGAGLDELEHERLLEALGAVTWLRPAGIDAYDPMLQMSRAD